jgi:hypothetical protein
VGVGFLLRKATETFQLPSATIHTTKLMTRILQTAKLLHSHVYTLGTWEVLLRKSPSHDGWHVYLPKRRICDAGKSGAWNGVRLRHRRNTLLSLKIAAVVLYRYLHQTIKVGFEGSYTIHVCRIHKVEREFFHFNASSCLFISILKTNFNIEGF